MRPFFFLSALFSFFSAAVLVVADHKERIGNEDSQISYSPGWKPTKISFADGDTTSVIDLASGTASLKIFDARKVGVNVYVQTPGQKVQISVDGKVYDVFPNLFDDRPVWKSDDLDPSVPHDVQVIKQNPAGQWTALDSFVVFHNHDRDSPASVSSIPTLTSPDQLSSAAASQAPSSPFPADMVNPSPSIEPGNAFGETNTSTDGSNPTQPAGGSDPSISPSSTLPLPQSSSTSSTEPGPKRGLSGGKLAAIIVVCIAVPALITIGVVLYRRKTLGKRKAASTRYLEWMANRGQAPPRPPFPAPPPSERLEDTDTKEKAGLD